MPSGTFRNISVPLGTFPAPFGTFWYLRYLLRTFRYFSGTFSVPFGTCYLSVPVTYRYLFGTFWDFSDPFRYLFGTFSYLSIPLDTFPNLCGIFRYLFVPFRYIPSRSWYLSGTSWHLSGTVSVAFTFRYLSGTFLVRFSTFQCLSVPFQYLSGTSRYFFGTFWYLLVPFRYFWYLAITFW